MLLVFLSNIFNVEVSVLFNGHNMPFCCIPQSRICRCLETASWAGIQSNFREMTLKVTFRIKSWMLLLLQSLMEGSMSVWQ